MILSQYSFLSWRHLVYLLITNDPTPLGILTVYFISLNININHYSGEITNDSMPSMPDKKHDF